MWIKASMVEDVNRVARIFYVDASMVASWNEHRKVDEPRMLTGWCWEAKPPQSGYRTGIKTWTAAYIDAWYGLVAHQAPPRIGRARARLRVVSDRRVA